MLEKFKKNLEKYEFDCVIFMKLSKSFDSINYNLLFAKPHGVVFQMNIFTEATTGGVLK